MRKKYIFYIVILFVLAIFSYKYNANAETVDTPYIVGASMSGDYTNGLQGNLQYSYAPISSGADVYYLTVNNYSNIPYAVINFMRPNLYGATSDNTTHYRIKYRINLSSQTSQSIQFGFVDGSVNMTAPNVVYSYTNTAQLTGYKVTRQSYNDISVMQVIQGAKEIQPDGTGYVTLDFFIQGSSANNLQFFVVFGNFANSQTTIAVDTIFNSNVMTDMLDIMIQIKNDTDTLANDVDDANQENVDEIESYDGGANQNIIDGSSNMTNNQNDVNNSVNYQIEVIDYAIEQYTIPSLNDDTGILLTVNNFLLGNDFFLTCIGTVLILIVIDVILIKS